MYKLIIVEGELHVVNKFDPLERYRLRDAKEIVAFIDLVNEKIAELANVSGLLWETELGEDL